MTPNSDGRGVGLPKWPDRSARTLAEVWRLTAEQVAAVRASLPADLPHDWRRA